MKFISWNVNGIRAAQKKGFSEYFLAEDADFSAFKKQKQKESKLMIIGQKVIIHSGTPRRKPVILGRQYFASPNL